MGGSARWGGGAAAWCWADRLAKAVVDTGDEGRLESTVLGVCCRVC